MRAPDGGRAMTTIVLAVVLPRSYHHAMPGSVVKKSFSLPVALFTDLENQAAAEGLSTSAAVSSAVELWLKRRLGLEAVEEWEAIHGAFTQEELAEADRILDAA